MFDSVLNTSVSITALLQWPYAMYYIRHIQNFGIFNTVSSGVCEHIQSYSALLWHATNMAEYVWMNIFGM